MINQPLDKSLWRLCIKHGGFVGGYAKIGLQMILVAVGDKKLYQSRRKRIERSKEYHKKWRIKNKEKLRNYRIKKYWENPEEEREKRRQYYRTHREQWKLRAIKKRKAAYAK